MPNINDENSLNTSGNSSGALWSFIDEASGADERSFARPGEDMPDFAGEPAPFYLYDPCEETHHYDDYDGYVDYNDCNDANPHDFPPLDESAPAYDACDPGELSFSGELPSLSEIFPAGSVDDTPPEAKPPARLSFPALFVRFGFYSSLFLSAVCAAVLLLNYYQSFRDARLYEELTRRRAEAAQLPPALADTDDDGRLPMLSYIADVHAQNNDTVGWITVKNTAIDFPVMQYSDNDYYLTVNFSLQQSKHGAPFVDYRIDLSGQPGVRPDNLIIYGHNMDDGQMFNDFLRYGDPQFYTDHPAISVSSLYDEREYMIFAAFISNGESRNGYVFPYHMYLNFSSEEEFDEFVAQLRDRSLIDVDIDVEYGDKLLCASTCTYEFDGARFVVFARELRDGETTQARDVSRNPRPLYPAAFARLYGGRSDS